MCEFEYDCAMAHMWTLEASFQEAVLSFRYVSYVSGDCIQVTRSTQQAASIFTHWAILLAPKYVFNQVKYGMHI